MPSQRKSQISTIKSIVTTIGSVTAAAMVVQKVAHNYLPPEVQSYLYLSFRNFINKFSTHLTMVIYESEGFHENEIYDAMEVYIAAKMSTDIRRFKVSKHPKQNNVAVAMEVNEKFTDVYKGVKVYWSCESKKTATRKFHSRDDMNSSSKSDLRWLELTFHRQHKDLVLNEYLPFILKEAELRKQEEKTLKLFTLSPHTRPAARWMSVNLDHPANFTTLAMDSDIKEKVMKDLDRFVERREYYRRVGKAWKRGYLLYGPPGTGKSSLIAAMANYLNFDIYDLQLTDISSNSDLRAVLMTTANRSILVVEDIDCSKELHDRAATTAVMATIEKRHRERSELTLSGFLNFVDGLWSNCGDERIIIFTTNHKDKLDPALIRPGRMDVHIHMSYCTPCGFRQLVSNYLGITQHDIFQQIEELMYEIEVTPAEIAEQLLKDDDPDIVFSGLVKFFDIKRKEKEQVEALKRKEKEQEIEAKTKPKTKAKKSKEGEELALDDENSKTRDKSD